MHRFCRFSTFQGLHLTFTDSDERKQPLRISNIPRALKQVPHRQSQYQPFPGTLLNLLGSSNKYRYLTTSGFRFQRHCHPNSQLQGATSINKPHLALQNNDMVQRTNRYPPLHGALIYALVKDTAYGHQDLRLPVLERLGRSHQQGHPRSSPLCIINISNYPFIQAIIVVHCWLPIAVATGLLLATILWPGCAVRACRLRILQYGGCGAAGRSASLGAGQAVPICCCLLQAIHSLFLQACNSNKST